MPESTVVTPDLPKLARQAWLTIFQVSRWLRPLADDVLAVRCPRPGASRIEVNASVAEALFSWAGQGGRALQKCYAELNDHLAALPAVDEALNESINDCLTIVALASMAGEPPRGCSEVFDADDFHATISAAVRRLEARAGGDWGTYDPDVPLRWAAPKGGEHA